MIPNIRADRLYESPFVPYIPETQDTAEQLSFCLNCPLPDCDQDDPRCQFATPQYQASRLDAMERQAAYLCHLLVMKPVYRAVEAIRRELGR